MSFPFVQPYFGLGNSLQTAQAGGAGAVGGWVELGRATRGSEGALDVSSLADKRYYMVLTHTLDSVPAGNLRIHCNNDTGSNHAARASQNGGADFTEVSKTNGCFWGNGVSTECYNVAYWSNLATKEKLGIAHTCDGATIGAATAPERSESSMKWADTTNPIDQFNTTSSIWDTNSEMVVLGWDPADTHTSNFWEELASVDLSGGTASSLDSGTISAKKYLWVQILMEQTVDSNYPLRFNSDSGSNYAYRYRTNGGTEFSHTSQSGFNLRSSTANLPVFFNMFIVNNSANEKLIIEHDVKSNTAGAGNAPLRTEQAGKWANTSAQITSIQLHSGIGNLATNTIMKVWGSD